MQLSRLGNVWFVVPLLIVMMAGFNIPLVVMLFQSVFDIDGFTLEHFKEAFESRVYLRVMLNTFRIALITTAVCALVGYPLAYWLHQLSPRAQLIAVSAVIIPFWISILVRTYAWIVVLGNEGIVNQTLVRIGLVDTPVSFLYNELGVIIGTVNVLLPFLVLPLYASMLKIDKHLTFAAQTLGAGPWTIFWRVFFPLSVPALAAGVLLVFVMTLGFLITPAILGGGRVPMIANMLDLLINQMPSWELAAALSTLLLILTLGFFVGYLRLTNIKDAT